MNVNQLRPKDAYNLAIVGATGAVGETFLKILEQRDFPINTLKLLASKRSTGKQVTFKGTTYTIEELTEDSLKISISHSFPPVAPRVVTMLLQRSKPGLLLLTTVRPSDLTRPFLWWSRRLIRKMLNGITASFQIRTAPLLSCWLR